jgi:hypothetical protein
VACQRAKVQLTCGFALLWLSIGAINQLPLPWLRLDAIQAQQPAAENTSLQPFFDRINNPVNVAFPPGQKLDITPPPPQLNLFDRAVLRTCGSIGTKVRAESFKQLLSFYPDVLQKAQQVSGGELRPGRRSKSQFLEDLMAIWFNEQGFEHIFCGEIYSANDIGGLHFYGRYLQLQNEGIGGRLPNNSQRGEVVPGVIYTIGVLLKQGDAFGGLRQRLVTDAIKGYAYVSNAQEIFLDTTRAFKTQGNTEGACIFPVRDKETGNSFQAVFVRENNAIITFYPDATPTGKACKS